MLGNFNNHCHGDLRLAGEALEKTVVKTRVKTVVPQTNALRIWRPTKAQLAQADQKRLVDLIAPDLKVLFVGVNPGLYTAAIGHHFGHPGNRFWPALHAAGFTRRRFSPFERDRLLELGYGIVNIAPRPTRTMAELDKRELIEGGCILTEKILQFRPKFAAFIGVGAYRIAFSEPEARVGRQRRSIGSTRVWVLPDPSGLNAHYPPRKLAVEFAKLHRAVQRDARAGRRTRDE